MGSFQDNLPPCLLEWQRLTGTEAIAIEAGNWDELAQVQTAKGNLQSRMESLDFSHPDPKWIADIIAEEKKNRDLLQEKLDDFSTSVRRRMPIDEQYPASSPCLRTPTTTRAPTPTYLASNHITNKSKYMALFSYFLSNNRLKKIYK